MSSAQAYLNGRWQEGDLQLPVDDLGFTLGATVVERLRTFGGEPFRLAGHMRRLRRSLEIVGWSSDAIVREVEAAIGEFARRNASSLASGDDWSIAVFVTPGLTPDAAAPTVGVYGYPLPFANWAHHFDDGVHVCITDVRQVPTNCWPAELKCRSRMHYYLADREAVRRYPGSRAVLLDQRGFVGEASTANIVCYFRDRGLVVPRQEGVLPGISQEFLFELSDELGIERTEDDITPAALAAADEAMLTSTSACVLPVVKVDDHPIGAGSPGQLHAKLLAAWSRRVDVDISTQALKFANR